MGFVDGRVQINSRNSEKIAFCGLMKSAGFSYTLVTWPARVKDPPRFAVEMCESPANAQGPLVRTV